MARFVPVSGPVDRRSAIDALSGEGLRVTEWTDDPSTTYPEHQHAGREARIVLTGRMTIVASGRSYELGPGDRIDLDPLEIHRGVVGAEGVSYLAGSDGGGS
ncbi:MAG: cupin domain-containing protein [Actinomycetota bacterium]